MAVESQFDLDTFHDPSEFGSDGVIATQFGSVNVTITMAEAAAVVMPTQNGNSTGFSSVIMQAASVSTATYKGIVPTYQLLNKVAQDNTLTVAEGQHAGTYTIIDVNNNGQMTTLVLHKQ